VTAGFFFPEQRGWTLGFVYEYKKGGNLAKKGLIQQEKKKKKKLPMPFAAMNVRLFVLQNN